MNGSWRKSSASEAGNCVEARTGAGGVEVRDSKNPGGPVLAYTPAEWAAFLHGVKRGEFDDLAAP
jgi:hypothetical protein